MAAESRVFGGRHLKEPVSAWKAWPRKLRALSTVSVRGVSPSKREDLGPRLRELQDRASSGRSLPTRIWRLWRAEGLAFSYADRHFEQVSFRGANLPLETGPPVQCGLSMAAVLHLGFDAAALQSWLLERADERFVDFGFESLGLMLAAYERGRFARLTAMLGSVGLLRRYRLSPPRPEAFLSRLSEEQRRLAAHGYGRLLYFRNASLGATIRAIGSRPFLPRDAAVKGAVAAYVLVNSRDLGKILHLYDRDDGNYDSEALVAGLDNVLTLLAWSMPASLQAIAVAATPWGQQLQALIAAADQRREAGLGPGMVA